MCTNYPLEHTLLRVRGIRYQPTLRLIKSLLVFSILRGFDFHKIWLSHCFVYGNQDVAGCAK